MPCPPLDGRLQGQYCSPPLAFSTTPGGWSDTLGKAIAITERSRQLNKAECAPPEVTTTTTAQSNRLQAAHLNRPTVIDCTRNGTGNPGRQTQGHERNEKSVSCDRSETPAQVPQSDGDEARDAGELSDSADRSGTTFGSTDYTWGDDGCIEWHDYKLYLEGVNTAAGCEAPNATPRDGECAFNSMSRATILCAGHGGSDQRDMGRERFREYYIGLPEAHRVAIARRWVKHVGTSTGDARLFMCLSLVMERGKEIPEGHPSCETLLRIARVRYNNVSESLGRKGKMLP